MKTILISNDDGIQAPGLKYLVDRVKDIAHVVVAPDAPRSGQSGAITVDSPLRITPHDELEGVEAYSVNGTPVDCVKLARHIILPQLPDLMICGVNHGSNSGNCVLYSGTMGAVLEACTQGIPSIGFSLLHHSLQADFSHCGKWIDRVIAATEQLGLPAGVCLNVNIPAKCEPLGIKAVRAARGRWTDEYRRYDDPSGRPFYWLTGHFENAEPDATDTDEYWLNRKYVSVVPVSADSSAINYLKDHGKILEDTLSR